MANCFVIMPFRPEFNFLYLAAMYGSGQRLPESERGRAEFLVRRLLGAEPQIEILIDLKDWLDEVGP